MADLIERYKITANLPSVLMNYCNRFNSKQLESITEMIYELENSIESADAQPVKHGYWIKQPEKFQIHEDVINSNYLYSCSCCNASDLHSERANNDGEVKFCWRCGAKMDAEPDEPWQSE